MRIPELSSNPDLGRNDQLVSVGEECERLFKTTVEKIEEVYLDGTDEWVEENDPDLSGEMKDAEDNLNEVWGRNIVGNASISEFKQALKRYFEAFMKANERYKRHLRA